MMFSAENQMKKLIFAVAMLAISQSALADEMKYPVELTQPQWGVVGAALSKQVCENVCDIYAQIQAQLLDRGRQFQTSAKAAAEKAEADKRAKMKDELRSELEAERKAGVTPPEGDKK
jgi:hypothetical protein